MVQTIFKLAIASKRMDVLRLRVALNSSDYGIIGHGLSAFTEKILMENNAKRSFGYHGRSYPASSGYRNHDDLYYNALLVSAPSDGLSGLDSEVKGELAALIQSSPMLEEFFQLWDIPARDDDKVLCMNHMTCLAAILHCSKANTSFSTAIVNRILHDYVKSIHRQLSGGHTGLAHATFGLLIAMARTSSQNARDAYQKLHFGHESIQKHVTPGKQISSTWTPPGDIEYEEEKFTTDARLLLTILALVIMKAANDEIVNDMLSRDSTFRKLIASIQKDSSNGIILLLSGLRIIQRNDYYLSASVNNQLVDDYFLAKIVTLIESDNFDLQAHASRFLEDFVNHAMKLSGDSKRLGLNKSRSIAHRVLKLVDGSKSLSYRKVGNFSELTLTV
jgi:hypothetical protein